MYGEFVAIDWGTTNRRIFVIGASDRIVHEDRDDRGILAVAPGDFPAETLMLRDKFGALPIVCAGMVGSALGWVELPYVPLPGGIAELAAAAHWIEQERTAIVTGMSVTAHGRADVMRGEEVQFLGAVAAGMVPADAVLCQPGTHCKWARIAAGRIVGFTTAMTGELFALLGTHSLLASLVEGEAEPDAAFHAGVERAASEDLLADLFEIRAASLLGTRSRNDNAAYLSGLLIGSDVRARVGPNVSDVHVLADGELGRLYCAAIEAQGSTARLIDSRAAFIAGITRIWERMT
jgi:2-dehydro-3-deoxygalactonokinase